MSEIYRIRITPQAASDLEGVFEYISRDSPQNAAKMIDRLLAAIDGLEIFPFRYGAPQGGQGRWSNIRSVAIKPYLIRYRVDESRHVVYVLQVRHGSRRTA